MAQVLIRRLAQTYICTYLYIVGLIQNNACSYNQQPSCATFIFYAPCTQQSANKPKPNLNNFLLAEWKRSMKRSNFKQVLFECWPLQLVCFGQFCSVFHLKLVTVSNFSYSLTIRAFVFFCLLHIISLYNHFLLYQHGLTQVISESTENKL